MCHQKYLCKYDYLNIHLQEPRRTGFFLYVTRDFWAGRLGFASENTSGLMQT